MPCDVHEVLIGCQEGKTVLATGCGYQKIDGSGVHTFHSASRTELCCGDIGWTSQLEQRVWFEERHKMIELLGGTEPIEKFLQNVPDQKQSISRFNVLPKGLDVRVTLLNPRPSQDQRPHRGVNEEIHGCVGLSYNPTPPEIRWFPGLLESPAVAAAG